MLSPPSRMCSPTLMRSSSRPPSTSVTAIRLKSAVPPPTSQTSTMSPGADQVAPRPAGLRGPGVEGGQRLLQQGDVAQPRVPGGLGGQAARDLVERGGDGQDDLAFGEVVHARPAPVRRTGTPLSGDAGSGASNRTATASSPRCRTARAGAPAAGRYAGWTARTLPRSPAGRAPARRGRGRTGRRSPRPPASSQGSGNAAAGNSCGCGRYSADGRVGSSPIRLRAEDLRDVRRSGSGRCPDRRARSRCCWCRGRCRD